MLITPTKWYSSVTVMRGIVNAGSCVGAIAGKHRLWCPGSCLSLLPFATSLYQTRRYVFVFKWLVPGRKGGARICHALRWPSQAGFPKTPFQTTVMLMWVYRVTVRGCSALSDVSSNISLSPLYIPPHRH